MLIFVSEVLNKIFQPDDDHVDGVRPCLVTTSMSTVRPSGDI